VKVTVKMAQSVLQGTFALNPDFLSTQNDLLTVVIQAADKGNNGIHCFRPVSEKIGKDFLRHWNSSTAEKESRTEVHVKNEAEAERRLMNAKRQVLSSCSLKQVSADEALGAFLTERTQEKKTILELQAALKKLTVEKNLMEDSMYRAFAKCLNSKKEKIRQLHERIGLPVEVDRSRGTKTDKGKPKEPTRKSKRTFKNFHSDSESEDTNSQESPIPLPLMKSTAEPSSTKELYNNDTDTESDEAPCQFTSTSKANKPPKAFLIVSSEDDDSETDYEGDIEAIGSSKQEGPAGDESRPKETGLPINEKNNNNDQKGPSPSKQAKMGSDSDPMSKYDCDKLLDDL